MVDEVSKAKEVLIAAKAGLDRLLMEQTREIDAVRERYREALSDAKSEAVKAEWALKKAESAAAPEHEWEGKRVKRISVRRSFHRSTPGEPEYGIVRTCRIDTEFPENMTWRKPRVGDAFVRLLKKDGSEGVRIASLPGYGIGTWELDE